MAFHRIAIWDITCQSFDHHAELFPHHTTFWAGPNLKQPISKNSFKKQQFRFHSNFSRDTIIKMISRKSLKQHAPFSVTPPVVWSLAALRKSCSHHYVCFPFPIYYLLIPVSESFFTLSFSSSQISFSFLPILVRNPKIFKITFSKSSLLNVIPNLFTPLLCFFIADKFILYLFMSFHKNWHSITFMTFLHMCIIYFLY